jgi:hypothetical protein
MESHDWIFPTMEFSGIDRLEPMTPKREYKVLRIRDSDLEVFSIKNHESNAYA